MSEKNNTPKPELLPCPFCGCSMSIESNRDWHHLGGYHDENCVLSDFVVTYAADDEQRELLVADWNTRA